MLNFSHKSQTFFILLAAIFLSSCRNTSDSSPRNMALKQAYEAIKDSITNIEQSKNQSLQQLQQLRREMEQRLPEFTYIDNPHYVEGFTILKSWAGRYPLQSPGIVARITHNESFELIAAATSPFTSIRLKCGGKQCQSENIPHDQGLNYRTSGLTTVAFCGAKADSIGQFINSNVNSGITIEYLYNNAPSSRLDLTPGTREMIAYTWDTYRTQCKIKRIELMLPLLSKKATAYTVRLQELKTKLDSAESKH